MRYHGIQFSVTYYVWLLRFMEEAPCSDESLKEKHTQTKEHASYFT